MTNISTQLKFWTQFSYNVKPKIGENLFLYYVPKVPCAPFSGSVSQKAKAILDSVLFSFGVIHYPLLAPFRLRFRGVVHMDCWASESPDALHSTDMNSEPGDFECNICFELSQDPIVTLCGHLYCWPCLYEWLQVHSHSHECPVCKALVEEHKLVPIYGRGKASSDPRSRLVPGINIPKRPVGQRPQTAPAVDLDYLQRDELDPIDGFMPVPSARFGNSTLSSLFGAIPALFNLHVHGFHDATTCGATTGVPYLFSGSFHGGYAHGFHQSNHLDGTKFFMKMLFVIVGFLLIISLIS